MNKQTFILPILIPPKEDQLLYDYIIQLGRKNLFYNETFTSKFFYGNEINRLDSLLPLKTVLGIGNFENPLDIIMKTSILPVLFPFLDEYKRLLIANYLFNYDSKIGDLALRKVIYDPKICPLCVKEDAEKYGSFYLHRSHQIIGVNICHKHKVPLHEAKANEFASSVYKLEKYKEIDTSSFNEYEEKYADLIYRLLNKPQTIYPKQITYDFFKEIIARFSYLHRRSMLYIGNKVHWQNFKNNISILRNNPLDIEDDSIKPYIISGESSINLLSIKLNDKEFITTPLGLLFNKHRYGNEVRIKTNIDLIKKLGIRTNDFFELLYIDDESEQFLLYSYKDHKYFYLDTDLFLKLYFSIPNHTIGEDSRVMPGEFVSFDKGNIILKPKKFDSFWE